MGTVKGKCLKNLMSVAWNRCRSLGAGGKKVFAGCLKTLTKSQAQHRVANSSEDEQRQKKSQVALEGYFSVYVGPQRERFVVKVKFANHPLFVMLLEEAESEYGYKSEGPIKLPCDVDLFYKVLAEMDSSEDSSPGCSFTKGCRCLIPRSPGDYSPNFSIGKGYGAY